MAATYEQKLDRKKWKNRVWKVTSSTSVNIAGTDYKLLSVLMDIRDELQKLNRQTQQLRRAGKV